MMSFPSSSSAAAGAAVSSPADTGRKKLSSGRRSPAESRWRSGCQQRIYGRRLLEALRAARGGGGGGGTPPQSLAGPWAIKDAADSALALTARGQTRWSRAILFGRCSRRKLLLKNGGKIRRRRPPRPGRKMVPPTAEPQPEALKGRKVRDRLRLLSRLVPGCRKLKAGTPMISNLKAGTSMVDNLKSGTHMVGNLKASTPMVGNLKGNTPMVGYIKAGTPMVGNLKAGTPMVSSMKAGTPMISIINPDTPMAGTTNVDTSIAGMTDTPCIGLNEAFPSTLVYGLGNDPIDTIYIDPPDTTMVGHADTTVGSGQQLQEAGPLNGKNY